MTLRYLDGNHPSVVFIQKALRQIAMFDTMRRFPLLGAACRVLLRGRVAELMHDNAIHEQNCRELIRRYAMGAPVCFAPYE